MRVVLPAPDTPTSAVSTPGWNAPFTSCMSRSRLAELDPAAVIMLCAHPCLLMRAAQRVP